MPIVAEFVVPGKPVPKARPRTDFRTGRIYTPQKSRSYEKRVAGVGFAASLRERKDGQLVRRSPRWPTPDGCAKERPRRRGKRSPKCDCSWCSSEFRLTLRVFLPDRRTRDLDNIEKAILDGLTKTLWRDDRQAFVEHKDRSISRENPRVEVEVRCFLPGQAPLLLEEPAVELAVCPDCEGAGGFEVTLPMTGKTRTVVCGDCRGTGRGDES